MMIIDNKFKLGQLVYLKTDTEQMQRMVTMIKVYPDCSLLYQLSLGKEFSDHYEIEISAEENIEIKVK